jgi:hypothetical protein
MRQRAAEVRALAEGMTFAPAHKTMLALAATFEKLADRLGGLQHEPFAETGQR